MEKERLQRWNQQQRLHSSSFANNDVITFVMTPGGGCSSASATSNSITMTVNAGSAAAVSIASSAGTSICSSQSVTFTATPTNGGSSPSYQWLVNAATVGTNSSTYTTSSLANNDAVTCVMTSNSSCANPATATSNTILMTVSSASPAAVSITSSSGSDICINESVTFTATPTTGGTSPSYQWKRNGSTLEPTAALTLQVPLLVMM